MAEKVEPHEQVYLVERYSLFTRAEKWYIVFLISFAGWFSTLSSFIYYPAIAQVAKDLNVTIAAVNLTVTSYMAVSAVAPALVGDAADILGRRVLYLGVLTLYLAANIGIAVSQSFGAVLCLRMLQSAGISGMM
jgi:MFS family permease